MYQQYYQANFLHAQICKNKINSLTRSQPKPGKRLESGKINQTLTCDDFMEVRSKCIASIQEGLYLLR